MALSYIAPSFFCKPTSVCTVCAYVHKLVHLCIYTETLWGLISDGVTGRPLPPTAPTPLSSYLLIATPTFQSVPANTEYHIALR